ncbi:MAG: hypothetical protein IJ033_03870 [Clostridia bacterium]|nr:hypothetical protein [Clostridia bacterium]
MENKAKEFFKNNAGYLVVALVSLVYISTAIIQMGKTGKTIGQILTDGAVTFFLGFCINRIFEAQGFMNGDRDEKVTATIKLHGEIVEKISPNIDKLDKWCSAQNLQNLKLQRTKVLAQEGMKYDDFFGEDGEAKGYVIDETKMKNSYQRSFEKKRLRCYKKALRLKLTPIIANELTSEGGKQSDPFYLGKTKAQYEKKTSASNIISKVATACIFGYFGVELVSDFNVSDLVWTALQVCTFLITGVMNMYKAQMFVTDEYRGRVIKKIDILQKFDNYLEELKKGEHNEQNNQTECNNEV